MTRWYMGVVVAATIAAGCGTAPPATLPSQRSLTAPTSTSPAIPAATPSPASIASSPIPRDDRLYVELPKRAQGEWSTRVLLDSGDLLLTSNVADPSEDPSRFVSEIVRFSPSRGSLSLLLRLPAGAQAIQPIAAGNTLAWIEGPQDLRAFGWKIHLMDIHTGADRVVATDHGVHDIGNSVVPDIAFDGRQLIYTSLEQGTRGPEWRLHRLVDGNDTVLATLANAREERILSLIADDRTIAWSENVVSSDPHTKVGVYDITSGQILFRGRTSLTGTYQIGISGNELFYASQSGLLRSSRDLKVGPTPMSPEGAPTDTLAVVGDFVLYNNFDRGNTLAAINLVTGAHRTLASNVTRGPVKYGARVFWFEKAGNGLAARATIFDVRP